MIQKQYSVVVIIFFLFFISALSLTFLVQITVLESVFVFVNDLVYDLTCARMQPQRQIQIQERHWILRHMITQLMHRY